MRVGGRVSTFPLLESQVAPLVPRQHLLLTAILLRQHISWLLRLHFPYLAILVNANS